MENWNSANGALFYGKDRELTGADRDSQEVSVLALHLLQSALVYVNTLLRQLLPGMLCWGIGLGILTPAVVAAAITAAPPERSGLASGVNNTARQAGGAIGIAASGAIAGQPRKTSHFLTGLHVTGLVSTGLFVLAAAGTALLIPTHTNHEAHQ